MTVLFDLGRRAVIAPTRPPVRPVRRWRPRITIAALLSAGLHVLLIGGILLWMQRSHQVVLVPTENPATVELVMSPPGGEPAPSVAAPPAQPPAPDTPQETASAPQAPPVAPATTEQAAPAAAAPPPPAPPAPKPPEDKLTFDFAQAESDTNAWVTGTSVVPPSPDIKFHNRKPSYPIAAAQRGEQGTVILLIHVTADGFVTDAAVAQSSGFPTLDQAASDAVLTWHFLPSIKDGEPAPSDLPFKFVFSLD